MKNIYFFISMLFSVSGISPAFGEIYWSKLDSMEKVLCKDIMKGETYWELYRCTERMNFDSTEKLKKKNKEVIKYLSKLKDSGRSEEVIMLFKKDQIAWKNYVVHRCAYKGHSYDKDSYVYFSNKDLCEAVENYRRIETLEGEPSIP